MTDLAINTDTDRFVAELTKLATFSDCPDPSPAVTRVVFTDRDLQARAYLRSLYEDAGLTVRTDAIGNTFARWCPPGCDADASAVGTGSHTDALPFAGMYDGTVGVLGGLEAVRTLQRAGHTPVRPIDIIMFTSEEPTRFGVGCTGSRAMAGQLSPDGLRALKDDAGETFEAVRTAAGFTGDLASIRLGSDCYAAFVELHIEQGPELERTGTDLGIVTAIAAPAAVVFEVHGQGGHAGTVLMPTRRDALCAAAEMAVGIEQLALSSPSPDLVATVGTFVVHPDAVNSIPSHVRFTLDLRDTDPGNRDNHLKAMTDNARAVAQRRGVTVEIKTLNADPPATCDPALIAALEAAADAGGYSRSAMISRAYHDALFMATLCPTAMLFIPCRDGVSHIPEEFAAPEHLAAGTATLARTLAQLTA